MQVPRGFPQHGFVRVALRKENSVASMARQGARKLRRLKWSGRIDQVAFWSCLIALVAVGIWLYTELDG